MSCWRRAVSGDQANPAVVVVALWTKSGEIKILDCLPVDTPRDMPDTPDWLPGTCLRESDA